MSKTKKTDLKSLNAFLRKNKTVDFRTADLLHSSNINAYKWTGLENQKENLIKQLKAYQRLLRIVPNDREDLAKNLLKNGIQSSLQIASTPKKVFIKNNLNTFDNDEALAEQVYTRALAVRKIVALQYVNRVQQTTFHSRVVGLAR